MGDTKNYIKQGFATCNKLLLYGFAVFKGKLCVARQTAF